MTDKNTLKTIITDNQDLPKIDIWPRKLTIPLNTNKIITLAGVRRSGKTYHLFNLIRTLKSQGVAANKILYINFEDERLQLKIDQLDLIIESFRELYPEQDLSECYFFFDEIQEVEGWEKFVNRVYSSLTKNVFITGSNAKLLSKEIATALRGRTITYEVFPLAFSEYVSILAPDINPQSSQGKAQIINLFNQFLYDGGFPELIKQTTEIKHKTLQEYFNVMVIRDLIERYDISQGAILKYFCKRVVANTAGEFSVNKIYREFKSQGYQISKNTLYDYQDYLEAIYLARFIPKYSHSVVKTEMSQKKSYVIDTGLGTALDYKLEKDQGRLLETLVALELLKQNKQVTYQQNGSECDFVIMEKNQVVAAIQVTFTLNDGETKEREIKGLINACKKFNLKQGYILTHNQEDELEQDSIKISIIPTWKYFTGT